MNHSRIITIAVLAPFSISALAPAQDITITEPKAAPVLGTIMRPFHMERRIVSPANLGNAPRLESLVRAGNLYLTAGDVIALVLENNVDIAIQRYGPPLAREVLRRSYGGPLRAIDTPILAGPVSVSLTGVTASAVGLAEGGGVGSGGGIVVQLGETPPSLDPFLFAAANFQHSTSPQSNLQVNNTSALVNDSRYFELQFGQSFVTGTSAYVTFQSSHNALNSPSFTLNPFTSGSLDLYITQNLLQGFGAGINNRNIRVAKNNMKVTDLQVKRQVITTISAVLNLYWDLVSFDENERINEQTLAAAQRLYEDNKKQVELGTLPAIEVTRAAAEVSSNKENLLIAQTNVAQQETVLKNALSKNGVASPWLDDVHIIPLDKIVVPPKEDLKPAAELIEEALAKRPEIQQTRINIQSSTINLGGTRNALLPTLQAFVDFNNSGQTGVANPLSNPLLDGVPDPYFIGGYGNFLAQVFRRNYPSYAAGFSLNIPFRNRAAQGDYVADQLQLRQSQLQLQRSVNQVRVDVKNAIIGLEQARARYETAVATRQLAQQTLEAEQNKFKFGQSTIALVVQAQRDLAADQSAEVQSMANYTHAKIAFDEAVGQTLEVNSISMEEVKTGHVARQSSLPPQALEPPK